MGLLPPAIGKASPKLAPSKLKVNEIIVQADVLLTRDSWRLVEAVTGATSADDLSERLRALISE
jgi:hypothetical protein